MIYLEKLKYIHETGTEGEYWQQILGIKSFIQSQEIPFNTPVIFIVGENGMGKSHYCKPLPLHGNSMLKAVQKICTSQRRKYTLHCVIRLDW